MTVLNLAEQTPFVTKDGSEIRSILDRTNAPVKKQSLAEATVQAGGSTQRHYHKVSEEFYFILEGSGPDGDRWRDAGGGRGGCDSDPGGSVAYDHGGGAAAVSMLLRAAVFA